MATDNSPPRIRIILTVAFSSLVILVTLNYVFRSYFIMMTEEVEHEHLWKPVELIKLHEGEEKNLTSGALPIQRAMQELAQHGREGSAGLKQYADITPEPSNDLGAMVGWIRSPNQAVIDAINASAANDGGAPDQAAVTTDGGAAPMAAGLDAGRPPMKPSMNSGTPTPDAGATKRVH
jgi:hypothetical protein